MGTGGSEQITADWAAIARSSPTVLGVSAFLFYGHDIPASLRTFWNHDWQLRYMIDFESEESSHVQLEAPALTTRTGSSWVTTDGSCGMNTDTNSSNWAGNSDGGLCVDPAQAFEAHADFVETEAGRDHRAGLYLAWADDSEADLPKIRFVWQLSDGTEVAGDWIDTIELDTDAAGFQRYETPADSASSPIDTVGVTVELSTSSGVEAIDNLMLWSAPGACFDTCGG